MKAQVDPLPNFPLLSLSVFISHTYNTSIKLKGCFVILLSGFIFQQALSISM